MRKRKMIFTGLTLGALGGIVGLNQPIQSHAELDELEMGKNSIMENRLIFFEGDATTGKFYDGTRLAHYYEYDVINGTNQLFKNTEKGIEWWSPVTPTNMSGGISTLEYSFENDALKQAFGTDDSRVINYYYNGLSKSFSRNFKAYQNNLDKNVQINGTIKSYAEQGRYVKESGYTNSNNGTYRNKSGRWRFAGYAANGSAAQDPLFPADYQQDPLTEKSFDDLLDMDASKGNNRMFALTTYDTNKTFWSAKQTLIQRLINQNPQMLSKGGADYWNDILSLQTAPLYNPKTGLADGKVGGAAFAAYYNGGSRYQTFALTDTSARNMNVNKLTVYDAQGNPIQTITRDETGERAATSKSYGTGKLRMGVEYTVVAEVTNENENTETNLPASLEFDTEAQSSKFVKNDTVYSLAYSEHSEVVKGTKIPAGGKVTLTTKFTVGEQNTDNYVSIGAIIDGYKETNPNAQTHSNVGDNIDYDDDDLVLNFGIERPTLTAGKVELIEYETGQVVANPIPNHRYKMRYYYTVSGSGDWGRAYTELNYANTRKLPGLITESISTDTYNSKWVRLTGGEEYYIESDVYNYYELPYAKTDANLKATIHWTCNKGHDHSYTISPLATWTKEWKETYDYSIKNLQVVARTERDSEAITNDGKQHYGVSFTVTNTMPTRAANDNYAQNVNIRVAIGGKVVTLKEHLTNGENKDITVDVALDKGIAAGQVLNATVQVNLDQLGYETDTSLSNNSATTIVTGANIQTNTLNGGKVNPSNNTTNTGAYVDHLINPNKVKTVSESTDNEDNSWNQRYDIDSWSVRNYTYPSSFGTRTGYIYTPTSSSNPTVAQSESYEVTDVLMKSKLTTDKGYGTNGWVSMLTDSGHAQIKAGYGYQLKMIVEYKTNALTSEPNAVMNSNGSGTTVRPQNVIPNVTRDAYFQTSDGKIISATGINSTNQMFVPKLISATSDKIVIEYSLKNVTSMGIQTPGRIYIDENTVNGMYNVKAWTPTINGVPTKNKTTDGSGLTLYTPSPLNDIIGSNVSSSPKAIPTMGEDAEGNPIVNTASVPDMNILVVGSYKDDLVNSVVQ